jgi:hypothetical protein
LLGEVARDVTLRVHPTPAAMERVVNEIARAQAPGFAAYYHDGTKTIHACLAPRAVAALDGGRLPGLLLGALAHEAQHARGALTDPGYGARGVERNEGEADRDAVRWLDACGLPGAGAWRLMLESRRARLHAMGARPPEGPLGDPARLPAPQRATWYTWAYERALGAAAEAPDLPWILWDGSAEPFDGGYRLVAPPRAPALLLRTARGALAVEVAPLDAGRGQIELIFGFRGLDDYAKVAFLRRGGVRAMWRAAGRWSRDPLHEAPPLAPGRRVRLELAADGAVRVDGRVVLYVRIPEGACGIGVWDSAADFFTPSS